jgi:hypothetical protein
MAGLAEREREPCLEEASVRDVVDAFVEEEVGDTIDNDEAVDALDMLRPRCWNSLPLLGPAEVGETLRWRKRGFADDGPAVILTVVSMARRECIASI